MQIRLSLILSVGMAFRKQFPLGAPSHILIISKRIHFRFKISMVHFFSTLYALFENPERETASPCPTTVSWIHLMVPPWKR